MCSAHMIGELHISNCVGVYQFGSFHNCRDLKVRGKNFVLDHFNDLMNSEDILSLEYSDFMEIIQDDDLNVQKEETVYEMVMKWVLFNVQQRSPLLPKVLSHVRLPLIEDQYIGDNIGKFYEKRGKIKILV